MGELRAQFPRSSISFTINGKAHQVDSGTLDPRTVLAEYLRYTCGLTGTKIGCGEGGCGACTVAIRYPKADGSPGGEEVIANSCLRPVLSLDGTAVTTVEGLKTGAGYAPVQEQLAACGGSQCGYCSPGMVMSMYGLLSKSTAAAPSKKEIEQQFEGNICRCTGYRSILTAMHSFSGEARAQAHGHAFKDAAPPATTALGADAAPPAAPPAPAMLEANGIVWINAATLPDVFTAMAALPAGAAMRLTVGNTSMGVVKYYVPIPSDQPTVYINVKSVPELNAISTASTAASGGGITFGAAVTLSKVIEACAANVDATGKTNPHLPPIVRHLQLVAHHQVRDVASWVGNIMLAKGHPDFPSDVLLCLSSAGAVIEVRDAAGTSTKVPILQFVDAAYALPAGTIVASVFLPFGGALDVFNTYKTMPRHANAHALVNAGFAFTLDTKAPAAGRSANISACRLVVGGITRGPVTCPKTTAALTGQPLSLATCASVMPTLMAELLPPPPPVNDPNFVITDPAYRQSVGCSLFYKFFLEALVSVYGPGAVPAKDLSAAVAYERPVTSGNQSFKPGTANAPVGQAIPKIEGLAQASGETHYTSDLALPSGCLFASPVLATVETGTITSIDASPALAVPGVARFVSAADLKTIGASNQIGTTGYSIFATTKVDFYGQFVGLILADAQSTAERARTLVAVNYAAVEPAELVVSVVAPEAAGAATAAAAAAAARGEKYQAACAQLVDMGLADVDRNLRLLEEFNGDLGKTMDVLFSSASASAGGGGGGGGAVSSVTGSMATLGQKHFYMETQTTMAVPGVGGRLTVNCATQCMSILRNELAAVLNHPKSKITVQNTQTGGAYGGKAFLHVPVATATCVAALVAGKPVLCQLDRNTDMTSLGGRMPASTNFTASFAASGAITGLTQTNTTDAGSNKAGGFSCTSLNAYAIKGAILKTNTVLSNAPINSIMRAPGTFQGALFMEASIEAVATSLGVDPSVVQQANMDPIVLPVWASLQKEANVAAVRQAAEAYNAANRWRKRGVYCLPVHYTMNTAMFEQTVIVNVHEDGSIEVNHSGIEVGQGINTKVEQAVAFEFSKVAPVDMSLMQTLAPKTTAAFPDASPTWASGTSESCVYAAIKACAGLVKVLNKHKHNGDTWAQVVAAAAKAGSRLSGTGLHIVGNGGAYDVCCAACTVVELDVLTGEYSVLSTDIVYDAGASLNPSVDIGQIEGSFVQAMGMCLTEGNVRSKTNNRLVSNGTWDYKPPSAFDIPIVFNVTLLPGSSKSSNAVLGSKATGEPAYLLGITAFFALKQAIYAARKDAGAAGWFELNTPASPERVHLACAVKLV